jgi:hypothetical protein
LLTATSSISRVINPGTLRFAPCKVWKHLWTFDWSKWGIHDQRVSSWWIRMPASGGFGMLAIMQADGVAIATKPD